MHRAIAIVVAMLQAVVYTSSTPTRFTLGRFTVDVFEGGPLGRPLTPRSSHSHPSHVPMPPAGPLVSAVTPVRGHGEQAHAHATGGPARAPAPTVIEVRMASTQRLVNQLQGLVLETGVWISQTESEGMFKLDAGSVQCQSASFRVKSVSQSPTTGALSVHGAVDGCGAQEQEQQQHSRADRGTATAAPVAVTLTLSLAKESAATVVFTTSLGDAADAAVAGGQGQGQGSSGSDAPRNGAIKTGQPWARVVFSLQAEAAEKVWGLGVQYSFRDFKGKVVPIVVSEQGIGRGVQPLSSFLGENAGNFHTTYSAIPHYTTSTLQSVYLEGSALATFDFSEPARTNISVYYTSQGIALRCIGADSALEHVEAYTAYSGRMLPLPAWITAGPVIGYEGGTAAVVALHERVLAAGIRPAAYW